MGRGVLIADRDPVLARVISGVCEAGGWDVMAACDHSLELVDLVRRFGADVVITDRALIDGPVDEHLAEIRHSAPDAAIVMFADYLPDAGALASLGVDRVVRKPDFEELGHVLARMLMTRRAEGPPSADRRRPRRIVEPHPSRWTSPAGVEAISLLDERLELVREGDTVLMARFVDDEAIAERHGTTAVLHCEVELARLLSRSVRPEDLVVEYEDGSVVALLLGGDDRAARAVGSRVLEAWDDNDLPGSVSLGGAVNVEGESSYATLARSKDLPVMT